MSVRNGEPYLRDQLASFESQTWRNWTLFWRDDGSSDASPAMLQEFADSAGAARVRKVNGPCSLGIAQSYFTLLAEAAKAGFGLFAFADQDDIWREEKITRGVEALRAVPEGQPAFYCARQILVDTNLRKLGESPRFTRRGCGFPAALTQNVATGCTVMLNRAAAELVLSTRAPADTLHDWWCYLVVSAAGGAIIRDDAVVIMYRQHTSNVVGAPPGTLDRGIAALRRGQRPFMRLFRQNVAALQAQQHLLTPEARAALAAIADALAGTALDRLRALRLPSFRRQTWLEDAVFRLWFLLG